MGDEKAMEISRTCRLPRATVGLAVAILSAGLAAPRTALAQNLVNDPNFFSGLTDYQSSGQVVAVYVPFGPTPPNGDTSGATPNTAVLYGPGVGQDVPASVSQVIATVPNTVYTVTFAINFDPGITDTLLASFGSGSFSLTPATQPAGLATYTFTGTATGATTTLTFAADDGAMLVTELDVEAAPAPVAGGGILSFFCVLGGLAIRHIRRRDSRKFGRA